MAKTVKAFVIEQKWFFPLQRQLTEKLNDMYRSHSCLYQVIGDNRVIEGYLCKTKSNENVQVEAHMVKRGSKDTLLISEMNLVATN